MVVKGPHSLIVDAQGSQIRINLSGNSGMGTAGSGDVLTGCIAAMVCALAPKYSAQGGFMRVPESGVSLSFEAAIAGVFVHGVAGDIAAMRYGEDGMTSEDVLEAVPEAMAWFRNPSLMPEYLRTKYRGPQIV